MSFLQTKKNYRCVPSLQQFYSGGAFAVSSNGSFLACACGDSIKIVDSTNSSILGTIQGDTDSVTALALSPDDKLLFSAGHSRQICVWDLSTLKCLRSWKVQIFPLLIWLNFWMLQLWINDVCVGRGMKVRWWQWHVMRLEGYWRRREPTGKWWCGILMVVSALITLRVIKGLLLVLRFIQMLIRIL